MNAKPIRIALAVALATGSFTFNLAQAQDALPQQDNAWFSAAQVELEKRLAQQPNTNIARNVVVMIADGNGVGTNYAIRLFHGQQQGNYGDENILPHEEFPHLALVKTYNVNAQTPDSAGTATAILSGVKTKAGVVGVDETVVRGDCSNVSTGSVPTIVELMSAAGKATGIVTTARLTHATPASGYAHAADRDFEDDSALPEGCDIPDIASQLISAMQAGVVDIALGGGRAHFLPNDVQGEEGKSGKRTDGRNLVEEARALGAHYVYDDKTFADAEFTLDKPVLGLFEASHMKYEHDRTGEPSLAEMVEKTITALQQNENGFFLEVEAGRVDHANHAGNLYRTITDGVAFAEAVAKVREMTSEEDTLIIVTADHEHAIAFNGYCGRGTPINGLCYGIDNAGVDHTETLLLGDDGQPYPVVGYLSGAGSIIKKERIPAELVMEADIVADNAEVASDTQVADASTDNTTGSDAIQAHGDRLVADLLAQLDVTTETDSATGKTDSYRWIGSRGAVTQDEAIDPDYLQQAMIPLSSETHSGEDVAAYASGPFAHLVGGTVEQNYLFSVMLHAAGLGK